LSKRDGFLKNKVRSRHRHESKEELIESLPSFEQFVWLLEDKVTWLRDLGETEDLNKKQLILIDALQAEVTALFDDASRLVEDLKSE
jgi:hypothetical protein